LALAVNVDKRIADTHAKVPKGAAEYARNVIIGVNDRSRRIIRHNALKETVQEYFRPLPKARA
jgi:hypothetical protein